jgi:very-short-patch-repair endonuclease/predicted transcriptional regulator of viral defense system
MADVWSVDAPIGPQLSTHPDAAVGTLADGQHGVVSRRQLLDAGLSAKAIRTRVETGRLLQLHRGVYAVGHRHLRREAFWLAAVLAVPGGVLSHRDAAGLHGIRPANHRKIDVTTTGRAENHPRIAVHRTRTLGAGDVTTVGGIRVTTVARTLVDLATTVPIDHLAKAIREADRLRLLDTLSLHEAIDRTARRRGKGHAAIQHALAGHDRLATTHTRSSLEDAFLNLLHRHGLPTPQTNILVEGIEVDAVWRAQRLVVELDGWQYHRTRHAFQRDRTRDAQLARAGYRVLRFTHDQVVREPAWVVQVLRDLLQPS